MSCPEPSKGVESMWHLSAGPQRSLRSQSEAGMRLGNGRRRRRRHVRWSAFHYTSLAAFVAKWSEWSKLWSPAKCISLSRDFFELGLCAYSCFIISSDRITQFTEALRAASANDPRKRRSTEMSNLGAAQNIFIKNIFIFNYIIKRVPHLINTNSDEELRAHSVSSARHFRFEFRCPFSRLLPLHLNIASFAFVCRLCNFNYLNEWVISLFCSSAARLSLRFRCSALRSAARLSEDVHLAFGAKPEKNLKLLHSSPFERFSAPFAGLCSHFIYSPLPFRSLLRLIPRNELEIYSGEGTARRFLFGRWDKSEEPAFVECSHTKWWKHSLKAIMPSRVRAYGSSLRLRFKFGCQLRAAAPFVAADKEGSRRLHFSRSRAVNVPRLHSKRIQIHCEMKTSECLAERAQH